jgi:heme/copper-type cytochrome/quinol oxidase subunit 2
MNQRSIEYCVFGLAAMALAFSVTVPVARAEDPVKIDITLKDFKFDPAEPHAPAGKPIVITLKNLNTVPAEFESKPLRVEKVVVTGGTITMLIRPQEKGRYRFFDDFHRETEGFLIVE